MRGSKAGRDEGHSFPPNAGAQWFCDWGGARGSGLHHLPWGGAIIKRGDSGWVSVRYGEILSLQMRHEPPACTLQAPPSSCPISAKWPTLLLFYFSYHSLLPLLFVLFSFSSSLFFPFLSCPLYSFSSLLSYSSHPMFLLFFYLFTHFSFLLIIFSSFLFLSVFSFLTHPLSLLFHLLAPCS